MCACAAYLASIFRDLAEPEPPIWFVDTPADALEVIRRAMDPIVGSWFQTVQFDWVTDFPSSERADARLS